VRPSYCALSGTSRLTSKLTLLRPVAYTSKLTLLRPSKLTLLRPVAYTVAYSPCAPRLLTLWARAGPGAQGQ